MEDQVTGSLLMGINSPAYGYGMTAKTSGGWGRGFSFLDSAGSNFMGGFSGYGSGDTLNYIYMGIGNNDYQIPD